MLPAITRSTVNCKGGNYGGGDFNISLDRDTGAVDNQGPSTGGRVDYAARAVAKLVADFGLLDAWKVCNPGGGGVTWCIPRGMLATWIIYL